MAKTFELDGKRYRLHPDIPASQIRHLVGTFHVSKADGEVVEHIAKLARGQPGWTVRTIGCAGRYALHCHRANQGLYRLVMGGGI